MTVAGQRRRRAPAMSPEDRRDSIVRATLPLLAEHGGNVTTSQIARAAGIAEGTVFRVFADKKELIGACLEAAFRPDGLAAELTAIPATEGLHKSLVRAVRAIGAHVDRLGSLMQGLAASGYRQDDRENADGEDGPMRHLAPISQALSALLAPHDAQLRLGAERSTGYLMGLVFVDRLAGRFGGTTADPEELVDLFLRGAGSSTEEGPQA
ncbi:TetR/AcrR family transcriptional regulator [Allokutzneria albata]|uniref:DNA-binding transcriptional regulator, AcrR family n=1 Tax=Allokutzneria albata TaxID=211114 RepID=A0A1H0C091_ALLAB|nr:TetR/AcrR family transcriptional regulator [Allokutzneria albata]SDN51297.1 DNA-binding transcriptional regulator, AcrR family [Allokutzneria albata]